MLHYLWMLIVGLIVGVVAKHLMGLQLGFWMTVGLGIVGSYVGGLIGNIFSKPADGQMFHPAGIIMSIIGACIVLWGYTHLIK
jgi:uncharacterized membrane protein YeaQ/YmgE (transglycosylase-associated protein family)